MTMLKSKRVLLPLVWLAFAVGTSCGQDDLAPATAEGQLRRKGFSVEWIDGLVEKGMPRIYTGDELKFIGQPVGGLFAGQLYLGGDGRLWYWDVFNQRVINPGGPGDKFYNNPMVPNDYRQVGSGFLVDFGGEAVLLDGRGFEDVRFRGEFPIARVDLKDPRQPLEVRLEALSPFSPTQTDDSSLPATVMSYRLTNTSVDDVTFRVGAWLENASNRNAVRAGARTHIVTKIPGVTGLLLGAEPVVTGDAMRDDRILADFEDDYDGWQPEGDAFGEEPFLQAGQARWQTITGHVGKGLANSHNSRIGRSSQESDTLTGTLSSPEFEIDRNFLTFTVAGGAHDERGVGGGLTAVEVLAGDEVIATVTGQNRNEHRLATVNLNAHAGKRGKIRIVDTHKGAWGHIQADQFVLTDVPKVADRPAADTGSMAIALLGMGGVSIEPVAVPASWKNALARAGDAIPANAGVLQSKSITLPPGKSTEIRFAVCWFFPNGHLGSLFARNILRAGEQRNYYAKRYRDAAAVAADLAKRHDELVATTRLWRDTWYDSTLPTWFLDRTFFNASTLASTAAIRHHDAGDPALDGRVYFWEGVYLGMGTCTHVTHYEQAVGRLFPDAARAQRSTVDYHAGWDEKLGYVKYRAEWDVGHHFGIPHAIDGHAGTVLRTWREHTTAPDDTFLRSVWPRVKRATVFMIDQDAGRGFFEDLVPEADRNSEPDGVLSGPQYNTLDKVWDGTIPWTSGLYLASLRAAAEMAKEMGDADFARECERIVEIGGPKLSRMTFNKQFGYFVQRPDQQAKYVNSNDGCHIDQLLGNYWTWQAGLTPVFPREQARSALRRIFTHNLYRRVGDYRDRALIKVSRFYADADEPGTFICTFPHGGAKKSAPAGGNAWDGLVVGYFSECMTGFTYQAAAHLISEGMVTEGLALCRAIHDRYAEAPERRNPFNEIEYGNHYTRAMSGYAPFVAMCGFTHNGPKGEIGFAPKMQAVSFKAAFTAAEGWGSYSQRTVRGGHSAEIKLVHGSLRLSRWDLPPGWDGDEFRLELRGQPLECRAVKDNGRTCLQFEEVVLQPGDAIRSTRTR